MKTCSRCGETKSLDEFRKRRKGEDRYLSHCKTCIAAHRKRRYNEDEKFRQRCKTLANESYWRARRELISAYGGRCACCGESEHKFLSVDHVDGGGRDHRKVIGDGGKALCNYLRKMGYPQEGFQLLCFNCNCAKGFFGECPHQTARHSG